MKLIQIHSGVCFLTIGNILSQWQSVTTLESILLFYLDVKDRKCFDDISHRLNFVLHKSTRAPAEVIVWRYCRFDPPATWKPCAEIWISSVNEAINSQKWKFIAIFSATSQDT